MKVIEAIRNYFVGPNTFLDYLEAFICCIIVFMVMVVKTIFVSVKFLFETKERMEKENG